MTLQRGRLGRQDPALRRVGRAEAPQAERAEAVGVADAEQSLGAHEDERVRALEDGQHGLQRGGEVLGLGEGVHQQLGHDVAVGGDGARQHPDLLGQLRRVGQVAVVPEREAGAADGAVDRLGPRPVRRAVRRVAGVANREVPLESRQGALVEHGGDQAHVLDDRHRVAVAHRHAGRLLPAVLQGEETVEREVGHPRSGRVDPEDTAGFLHAPPILAQPRVIRDPPGRRRGSLRRPAGGRRRGGRAGHPG